MDKLKSMYNEYKGIQHSYEGNNTNWRAKVDQLEALLHRVRLVRVIASNSASFNEWIKRKLIEDIKDELKRVRELAMLRKL